MAFSKINIEDMLKKSRRNSLTQTDILQEIKIILATENINVDPYEEQDSGSNNLDVVNDFNLDLLEPDKIFHLNDIKSICIDYRLRFLDSKYFKNAIPLEAITKIKHLEKEHHTILKGYKVMAPSRLFKLENDNDPLLFVPIANDYFYLIHKWGKDLHPLRKWIMKPFKNIENLAITILAISFIATFFIPKGLFSKENSTVEFFLLYFFVFKSIASIVLFYGFALGKNFNTVIWNSKYYNA